jgi:undecaprenyl-diphosphatase
MEKKITVYKAFERLTCYDVQAMRWVLGRPRAAMVARVARQVSRVGDGPAYVLLALSGIPDAGLFVAALALGFAFELPAYMILKRLIQRPRPADAESTLSAFIQPSDKFSFPSGHTAAAFMVALVVASFFPWAAALAYALALSIGASRVLLGVHFPSDIAAGALLGTLAGLLSLGLL